MNVPKPASTTFKLDTDPERGLGQDEARRRLAITGHNELPAPPPLSLWRRALQSLTQALPLVLLAATAISALEWALEQPRTGPVPYEALVIALIVALNTVLDLIQQTRADSAVRALQRLSAPEATVIRDGRRQRVPARELVPGDVILVGAGDTVPADAHLVTAANLRVDEAMLTGESLPAEKALEGPDADRLFSGTTVVVGRGRAVVTTTGRATEIGRISGMVAQAEKAPTPLERELDRTGKRLAVAILILCVLVFAAGVMTGRVHGRGGLVELALFAVAMGVAAIPEGLSTTVTTCLSRGVRRMALHRAIVRRLPAVETLGAASVICTDKTGTLTQNRMVVQTVVTADARVRLDGEDPLGALAPAARWGVRKALRAGALANDATLSGERAHGDPTEAALLVAARNLGADSDLHRFPRRAEVPFTAERKRHATIHEDTETPDQWRIFVKGAPDLLLERCTDAFSAGRMVPLTDARRRDLEEQNAALTAQGLRTLALAERVLEGRGLPPDADGAEEELVFLGLAGLLDPPRPEAAGAVRRAQEAGIRVVMATGDHPDTARAIARELGILADPGCVLTGAQMAALDEPALDAIVEEVCVYARVAPADKLRIVRAWQRRGEVVAMTGDGVNDAPALRAADIGIAMGVAGTDVAREAADMVLADDNFATIVHAIEEGRGIFDNIRRSLLYLLEGNIAEVMVLFVGILLVGLVAPERNAELMLPLIASQILWVNLITDGPPALALAVEPAAWETMRRPPRDLRDGILGMRAWLGIGATGMVITAGTLVALDAGYPGGLLDFAIRFSTHDLAERHARTLALTTLVLFQLGNALLHRAGRRSRWLLAALAVSLLLQVALVTFPFLRAAFGTVPLTATEWLLCAGLALSLPLARACATRCANRLLPPRKRRGAAGQAL